MFPQNAQLISAQETKSNALRDVSLNKCSTKRNVYKNDKKIFILNLIVNVGKNLIKWLVHCSKVEGYCTAGVAISGPFLARKDFLIDPVV
jgi:hypothetical protein